MQDYNCGGPRASSTRSLTKSCLLFHNGNAIRAEIAKLLPRAARPLHHHITNDGLVP
jgi:hypothetical protein